MKHSKNILVLIFVLFLILILFYAPSLNKKDIEINNFEECADAGYAVGESYPRQCWTPEGKHFVEVITWKNDGIILMQNSETGEYACFGCGKTICIDPIPIMKPVEETLEKYCSSDFEIIGEGERFNCSKESRNTDFCIEIYQPVCGWFNPEEIVCVKYPCAVTFSNSCFACQSEDILYYTNGECPK